MAKLNPYRQLDVSLPASSYPIYIGRGVLEDEELLHRVVKSQQILIVSNDVVAPLYLERVQHAFTNRQVDTLVLKDGECHKNQASLFAIYDTLLQKHHHRDTTLIALGGGVIGDMVGFAASTYQRGVSFIQLPTTLLAQVDASVGGKTAINHAEGKNMIGSFYQPSAVLMDVSTLKTLPDREFNAGLAEVIKYGLLVGGDFFTLITHLLHEQLTKNSADALAMLVERCCQIKATFVAKDEREQGLRALLNLGHTFAHALETVTQYQKWLHGEAVSIGLYCAVLLSYQLGYCKEECVSQVEALLKRANLHVGFLSRLIWMPYKPRCNMTKR